MYARHGRELMGCKSPVGVPALSEKMMVTTSRRQGQSREGLSEGSPSANVRADGQKPHRRLSSRASQHNMTKPAGDTEQGKCGGCVRTVHVLIRGDLPDWRSLKTTGAGLRPRGKRLESPPNPAVFIPTARRRATVAVFRQKSADGIVAQRPP